MRTGGGFEPPVGHGTPAAPRTFEPPVRARPSTLSAAITQRCHWSRPSMARYRQYPPTDVMVADACTAVDTPSARLITRRSLRPWNQSDHQRGLRTGQPRWVDDAWPIGQCGRRNGSRTMTHGLSARHIASRRAARRPWQRVGSTSSRRRRDDDQQRQLPPRPQALRQLPARDLPMPDRLLPRSSHPDSAREPLPAATPGLGCVCSVARSLHGRSGGKRRLAISLART